MEKWGCVGVEGLRDDEMERWRGGGLAEWRGGGLVGQRCGSVEASIGGGLTDPEDI